MIRAAGALLLVLAAAVAVTGGFQLSFVSATSATRLFFEGAVLLLMAECGAGAARSGAGAGRSGAGLYGPRMLAAIALFLIAAAADSHIRRVGDGFEYLGMARNLARLSHPSLSDDDAAALTREMAARGDPSWDGAVFPALRGADGRYDFPHFWLCSLLAAPFVAVASLVGLHPALGFTMMNLALVLGVCWLLVRAGASAVAVLFAALVLWWIDKAHAEIFFAALTAGALLLRAAAPAGALLMLGAAAAQGPVLTVLLAACAVEACIRHGVKRRIVLAALAALGIAALHPLYYLWRLGIPSPLPDTVVAHIPGVRAIVTPLVDLNLGVFWFAPLLCALTVAGAVAALRTRAWDTLPAVAGAAALLAAASVVTNVNHGGTPDMSRYGLWVVSLLIPVAAAVRVPPRWVRPLTVGTMGSVVFAAVVLHPERPDAGITPEPTPLARFVWTRAPALDNPLPEVFVERVVRADGAAAMPVAMRDGSKALITCDAPGGFCYANGGRLVPAPRQPGFTR